MSVYLHELNKPRVQVRSRKSRFWIHVLLLLLAGFYLRVWSMASESPSFAEVMAALISEVPFGGYISQPQPDYCPPVFYLLAHPINAFSMSLEALRVLSIIAGGLTPLGLYLMGRRLYGETAAVISAYLLLLNPLHVYFSQEFQPSALFVLLSLGGFLAMIRSAESNRWRDWLVYDLIAVILLHTQREAAFMVGVFPVVQLCRALFFPPVQQERRMHRLKLVQGIVLNHFIVIAVSLPWLFIMPNKPQWQMNMPSLSEIPRIFGHFYLFGLSDWNPLRPWLATLILALLMLPPLLKSFKQLDFRTFAALAVLLLGIAVPFAYSMIESPRFVPEREGFTAVPWFCLTLGILLSRCNWAIKFGLSLLFAVTFLASSVHQARTLQKTATTDMLNAIIKDGAKEDAVLAFWPDFTTNLGQFWKDYYNRSFHVTSARDLLTVWADVPSDKPLYFVVSQFPGNTPHLYTFQGALAQYAGKSEVLWQNRLNMVVKASDLNQQALSKWYSEPRSLKILDQPSSNTQFIYTAADELFRPPMEASKKDPQKITQKVPDDEWPFAYNRLDLSYEPTGHRFVWTTKPTVQMELPVRLSPGHYTLKLHCSPEFDQPEYGRYKNRTVELTLRAGEDMRKVKLEHAETVTLSFTTDVELDRLRVTIAVDQMYDVPPPAGGSFGVKIYSIAVDQVTPGDADKL